MTFPSYWICSGSAQQDLFTTGGTIEARYIDDRVLILDVWDKSIYQFYQPTLSSRYEVCKVGSKQIDSQEIIQFSYPDCSPNSNEGLQSNGALNLTSGSLIIHEVRMSSNQPVKNEGRYQCRYLGHSFSFAQFNYVEP